MTNLRIHGQPPHRIALVHGGPGASGEMAPVARELAAGGHGVLEPLQTADAIDGQVGELAGLLREYGDAPVILAGHSWGAWLSCLTAAAHPELVRKLILIGSGPFEESYATGIFDTRLSRLTETEREEAHRLMQALQESPGGPSPEMLARFGALMNGADSFDPLPPEPAADDGMLFQADIFRKVWPEADSLRQRGELLTRVARIVCPVVAVHGDYDPHPAEGVSGPLGRVIGDFRFILLDRCGHTPWAERQARDHFYTVLAGELTG